MSEALEHQKEQRPGRSAAWAGAWHAPKEFSLHIFSGALIFTVLALAAVGLAFLVAWLKTLNLNGEPIVGKLLLDGLQLAEYALFVVDLFLLLVFLLRTVVEIIAKMIEDYRR